jgi:hypothetical protein
VEEEISVGDLEADWGAIRRCLCIRQRMRRFFARSLQTHWLVCPRYSRATSERPMVSMMLTFGFLRYHVIWLRSLNTCKVLTIA